MEKLTLFLDTLESTRSIVVAELDTKAWKIVMKIDLPELHDRMIVATYLRSDSEAILTDDSEIASLSSVKVIWTYSSIQLGGLPIYSASILLS